MIAIRSLGVTVMLLFAHALIAQQSQWVYPGTHATLSIAAITTASRIPDYSFAGYPSGGVTLPTIAAQTRLLPTGADDTAAIQRAIDTVSARPLDAEGFRGAAQLGPGAFHCSVALVLGKRVVLLSITHNLSSKYEAESDVC